MRQLLLLLPLMFSCIHPGQIRLEDVAVDCTTPALSQLIDEFAPTVKALAAGTTTVDALKSSLVTLGEQTGACVVAELVAQATKKSISSTSAEAALSAAFQDLRKTSWRGAIYKTKYGLM